MSRRNLTQPSLADAMVSGYGKVGGFLERIEKAFDWSAFEALLALVHASSRGVPGWPPLVVFKIVLLQQWHTLSDPGAEEAVRDRLSFRRFCGLSLEVETPDHASIWRFRKTIDQLGLSAGLLAEVNRQLDALGLIVKRGTLVDAALIAAAVKRPPYGSGGVNPRDPDARVTTKRRQAHFGYKAHLAVDQESGLCAGRNDLGQCPLPVGWSADPGRRARLFRREGLQRSGFPGDARTVWARRWRGVARSAASSARTLAEDHERLVVEHSLSRRARPCDDEPLVGHEPRPLPGARPQRLPP
jgi:hypothetical protein